MSTPRIVTIIGFLATIVAIVLVPLILIPVPDRSQYFWCRIAWAVFLAVLVWAFAGNQFSRTAIPSFGGVLPAYGVVVFFYAGFSFALMVAFAWFDHSQSGNRVHIAVQVIGTTVLVIVSALLVLPAYFSRHSGSSVHNDWPTAVGMSPFQLAAQIRSQEDRLATPQRGLLFADAERHTCQSLKTLRENLLYSLDGIEGIERTPAYAELSDRVSRLCQDLSAVTFAPPAPGAIEDSITETQDLVRTVAAICKSLTRR